MQWGPAILLGLQVLNLALVAGRVLGVPLPSLPTRDLHLPASSGLFDTYSAAIARKAVRSVWSAVADLSAEECGARGEEAVQGGLKDAWEDVDLQHSSVARLAGEAYNSIETFLTTGDNAQLGSLRAQLDGRMARIRGEDGAMDWCVTD